jgi:hypothetical protein
VVTDDVETYSHTARLGGLRPLVIDRYVATQAAVNLTGPPSSKDVIKPFVRDFLRWLKDARNPADRELRRRILLLVTEGRGSQGTSERQVGKIVELVDDVYRDIA